MKKRSLEPIVKQGLGENAFFVDKRMHIIHPKFLKWAMLDSEQFRNLEKYAPEKADCFRFVHTFEDKNNRYYTIEYYMKGR